MKRRAVAKFFSKCVERESEREREPEGERERERGRGERERVSNEPRRASVGNFSTAAAIYISA
jgi:hypothetical protein